ncbi:hypothetical protein 2 [Haematobia irritans densovirus]|uniref:Uncharacterized protein n=1 Tax=Haematobia irritans densovirus TaxID=2575447 RepID=A0A4D6V3Z5_9VIRU|nr:hypothetical protein 2 [Haematobia irritans densovirus]QCH41364.1 hypothetical protein 2 [Haematobia irritans densovirus]
MKWTLITLTMLICLVLTMLLQVAEIVQLLGHQELLVSLADLCHHPAQVDFEVQHSYHEVSVRKVCEAYVNSGNNTFSDYKTKLWKLVTSMNQSLVLTTTKRRQLETLILVITVVLGSLDILTMIYQCICLVFTLLSRRLIRLGIILRRE